MRMGAAFAVAAASLLIGGIPVASASSFSDSQQETAQSGGATSITIQVGVPDAPTEFIVCTSNESYTLIHSGITFSGRTSCTGALASMYGRATIVNTLSGTQASCTFCQAVTSTGSGTLIAGFPYTYKYVTTLQLQTGFKWVVLPAGCVRVNFPTITCTFTHDFVAE